MEQRPAENHRAPKTKSADGVNEESESKAWRRERANMTNNVNTQSLHSSVYIGEIRVGAGGARGAAALTGSGKRQDVFGRARSGSSEEQRLRRSTL